ncbi:polyprenyl synthetase family protein [Kitasatospora sp. NPDC085879]|uniref:polyprenyl synthetase family protein n=1 Tax=Kitasatospora sp. NPDC085879 TaxID=3154769 RepID=UPI00343132EF
MAAVSAAKGNRTGADILGWAQELVGPALWSSAARLPNSIRRVVDHHFGWSGGGAGGGKALRPALVFLFAEAVGGCAKDAVPAAVAVELVHNFSLLHDDVMDGDAVRRHRPTAWTVFGVPQAILAGDALLTLGLQVLVEQDSRAVPHLSAALWSLVEGQSADVAFESRRRVGVEECTTMAAGKTGALIGAACVLGALAGGADPERAESARQYGNHLGLAFQLVDDTLGIWGDPSVTGKPVFADLAARKKSLPVVAALTSGTAQGEELAALYGQPGALDEAALRRAAELVEEAGGRRWCEARAAGHVRAALGCLEALGAASGPRGDLDALAAMVVGRDR